MLLKAAKLKKWIQIILVGASVMTLAACSAHRHRDTSAINDANMSYNDGAESSGVGDETNFDDQNEGRSAKHLANAKSTYYFDFDSNVVHESDKPHIHANAERLAARPKSKILLEGHTDPRGSREYNIGLGERRAKAVAEILIAKGVNPSQIRVVSYGAEKLASNGHTESDYQQDRRGVIVNVQR